ncbi:enhanced intracellular survival protein Eis [Natrialbaceae archaeon A-CW1-1]
MLDYRPLPDAQRDVFHEYVTYAFRPEDGPPAYDPDEHDTPQSRLGAKRGLYPDGADEDTEPLCVCNHYWFDATVRGESHPTPGLSAVASPPEHRRGGHVRQLLEASLEEYRERAAHFSILWPFRYRFYHQYGWETTNRHLLLECDPDDLSFAGERLASDLTASTRYRQLEADEWETLAPVYETHAGRHDLTLERDGDWWRYRVFQRWTTDPFVYVWERDGEPAAYVAYTIEGDWGDRTMMVSDIGYVDLEAFLAVLSFCRDHDSQVNAVQVRLPVDTPLYDVAPAPDALEAEYQTGPMVRIVDVTRTLSALSYPDTDASVTLEVSDPLVDWNDGRFALTVDGGVGTCERVDGDGTSADVILDIATLSQLAVGSRSVAALERVDRLEAHESVLAVLEGLFPERPVYLGDGF